MEILQEYLIDQKCNLQDNKTEFEKEINKWQEIFKTQNMIEIPANMLIFILQTNPEEVRELIMQKLTRFLETMITAERMPTQEADQVNFKQTLHLIDSTWMFDRFWEQLTAKTKEYHQRFYDLKSSSAQELHNSPEQAEVKKIPTSDQYPIKYPNNFKWYHYLPDSELKKKDYQLMAERHRFYSCFNDHVKNDMHKMIATFSRSQVDTWEFKWCELKSLDRCLHKIDEHWELNGKCQTNKFFQSQIQDIMRCSFVCDSLKAVLKVVNNINNHLCKPSLNAKLFNVSSLKNNFDIAGSAEKEIYILLTKDFNEETQIVLEVKIILKIHVFFKQAGTKFANILDRDFEKEIENLQYSQFYNKQLQFTKIWDGLLDDLEPEEAFEYKFHQNEIILRKMNDHAKYKHYQARDLPKILKANRFRMLKEISLDGNNLFFAHDILKKDKDLVLEAIKSDNRALRFVPEFLIQDVEIFEEQVRSNGLLLKNANKQLSENKRVVLTAVENDGLALQQASPLLKGEEEIVKTAIAQNPNSIKHADPNCLDNMKLVSQAVKQDGLLLQIASHRLRGDKFVIRDAVKNNPKSLEQAEEEIRNDEDFIFNMVKSNELILAYAGNRLKNNPRFMRKVLEINGMSLQQANEDLKGDKELVRLAVTSHADSLFYASNSLKADNEFMLDCVKIHRECVNYLTDKQKQDKEFIFEILKMDGEFFRLASDVIRSDSAICLEAIEIDYLCFKGCVASLKNDMQFCIDSFKKNEEVLHLIADNIKLSTKFKNNMGTKREKKQ